jgi:tagatose 1,6-diphosphate aldolase
MELIRTEAALTDKPIIYLSAGVSSRVFLETLELAVESGVHFHGVLAGRATWQDGVPVYVKGGASALEAWLSKTGLQNVREINKVLESAYPWHETRSMQG